jgi:hypothetical protein
MPGFDEASGLAILGTKKIDETLCEISDHLHQRGETARVVHISEFVLRHMKYPDLYKFEAERDFDEYVLPVSNFSNLEKLLPSTRSKVMRFLAEIAEEDIKLNPIDLRQESNQKMLLELVNSWELMGRMNAMCKYEKDCIKQAINHGWLIGFECLGLYVGGRLASFIIYELPADPNYALVGYARFNYEIPFTFKLSTYEYAQWFAKEGVKFVNIDADVGNTFMRAIKINLGPSNFFRKYTIVLK